MSVSLRFVEAVILIFVFVVVVEACLDRKMRAGGGVDHRKPTNRYTYSIAICAILENELCDAGHCRTVVLQTIDVPGIKNTKYNNRYAKNGAGIRALKYKKFNRLMYYGTLSMCACKI